MNFVSALCTSAHDSIYHQSDSATSDDLCPIPVYLESSKLLALLASIAEVVSSLSRNNSVEDCKLS